MTSPDARDRHLSVDGEELALARLALHEQPQLLVIADTDGTIRWANRRWADYVGTGGGARGSDSSNWFDAVHPGDRLRVGAALRPDGADASSPVEADLRLRAPGGPARWFRATVSSVDDRGVPRRLASFTDIESLRRAASSAALFSRIGEDLSGSLGLQATLDAVMQLVVPAQADWAFIALLDDESDLNMAAVYHTDPATKAKLATLVGKRYARGTSAVGSPAAIRHREPLLYTDAVYEDAAKVVEPDVLDVFWNAIGYDSVLVAGTTPLGTLTVLMSGSERRFHEDDVPFFVEVGRRITPAIANAESYERELHVARAFQDAALPAALPDVAGMAFSAKYEAGRSEALLGGDWYDAYDLPDGRVVVAIGDVCGSGLRAALTMATVRQAMRAVAFVDADPDVILKAGDRALRAEAASPFATAFVAIVDPVSQRLAYRSAGHPPAFLARPDGEIAPLWTRGLPLGLRDEERHAATETAFPPGSTLYLYTDGLTEATQDVEAGEERTRLAIAAARDVEPSRRAAAIYGSVLPAGSRDDVAILAVSALAPTMVTSSQPSCGA